MKDWPWFCIVGKLAVVVFVGWLVWQMYLFLTMVVGDLLLALGR